MNIFIHVFVNAIVSIPLHYFFGLDWTTIIIFIAAAILIDLDHILFFIFKHKTFNPKKWISIGTKMRSKMQPGLHIFHSPEFNILLIIYSFFNKIALIIMLSNLIHISLDILEHYRYYKNFSWIKEWSIIYSLLRA